MTITDPSRAHAHAMFDLLTGGVDFTTYFGRVNDADADLTYPYLIVWPPPARRTRETLSGSLSSTTTDIQLTAVGRSPDEALAALDRAAAVLQGVRPTLDGRNAGQIHQVEEFTPPPVTQSDVTRTPDGQPVFRAVDLYRLYSTPASA